MKTATDPRHKKRQHIIQELFKVDFHKQSVGADAKKIIENKELIDERIRQAAPEFPIDKINKIDLAILRLAIYELVLERTEPANVIIDEAIELAKEFSGETSPAFINGALGNIIRHEKHTDIQK
jgi:transcription antitermination protein NusB